jgi:hypothetical protein
MRIARATKGRPAPCRREAFAAHEAQSVCTI